jgi:predicted membrane chloride channel (bestrophin family)
MKLPGEFAVHYDTRNHWKVITQLYGSVWPFVWKYCVFNLAMMLLDFYVLDDIFTKHGITITDKGHTISIFFVAFFCVSRANMALARYNTARSNLSAMLSATRELVAAVVSTG